MVAAPVWYWVPSGPVTVSTGSKFCNESSKVSVTTVGAVRTTAPSAGSLPIRVACAEAGSAEPIATSSAKVTTRTARALERAAVRNNMWVPAILIGSVRFGSAGARPDQVRHQLLID